MWPYRDPDAAIYVGQMICAHLNKSQLSTEELALRLGLSVSKLVNLMTGRHYFPLELAKLVAEALGIELGEFVYFVLLQYFPKEAVDSAFESICAYAVLRHEQMGQAPKENSERKRKRKK